jgi:DNA repair protein RecN (Recombination protein N)
MIQTLSIRNYALIDVLEIRFSDNLTIITGETGAGKSIILGALGLILGKRADSKVLFKPQEKCVVEVVCNISAYQLQDIFSEEDIDYEDETVIRREIAPNGKSRAFINDTPVKVQTLERFSHALIDLHQQFDTLDIQTATFQTNVVDALANHKPQVQTYLQAFRQYEQNRRELQRLKDQSREADRETDFVTFQLKELKKAQLKAGEADELEQQQKQLAHAEDIQVALAQATKALDSNDAAIAAQLTDLMRPLVHILEFHPRLNPLFERLEAVRSEIEDISALLQEVAEETEYDPNKLEHINSRLNIINRLLKKYNAVDENELINLQKELQAKLTNKTNLTDRIAELENALVQQERELRRQAAILSQQRRAVCPDFEAKIQTMLTQLSMPYARLEVQIIPDQDLTASGSDQLQFMFCANKGARLETIKQVASGGELSRLALCIKSLVAHAIPLPTLIFDEIDAGVSGEVARQMSAILKNLAATHQVITITHSPQIAAKANTHYFVHKIVEQDRSYTAIRQLSHDERLIEIAKMLSGNPPTEAAKANALELLTN